MLWTFLCLNNLLIKHEFRSHSFIITRIYFDAFYVLFSYILFEILNSFNLNTKIFIWMNNFNTKEQRYIPTYITK